MGILKIDKTHQRPGKDSFKTRKALRKINAEDKISVIGIETIFSGERKLLEFLIDTTFLHLKSKTDANLTTHVQNISNF